MFYNKICEEILHNDSQRKKKIRKNTSAHSHEQAEDNNLINYYNIL